jgi:hypothetical protein
MMCKAQLYASFVSLGEELLPIGVDGHDGLGVEDSAI